MAGGVSVADPGANPALAFVFLLAAAFAMPAAGQLAAPNAARVSLGHIHLYVSDVPAQQKFWAAMGGVPGKCARGGAPDGIDCVEVPGVSLAMSQGETKLDPTAGRSLDHIGFEVKNLPEFLKRMEAEGVNITQGLTASNFVSSMRVAFITDPWGTKMEVTEGIAP